MTVLKLRSKQDDWTVFASTMRLLEDFDAASMSGRATRHVSTWGRLSPRLDDFGTLLSAAEAANTLRYVVYSYDTPIAANVAHTWVVSPHYNDTYSATTMAHISKIRKAADSLNESQAVSDMLEHYGA